MKPLETLSDVCHGIFLRQGETQPLAFPAKADRGDSVRAVKEKSMTMISLCQRGDIVVTQDYGVAAMTLGKGAKAIHQSGRGYTDENTDGRVIRAIAPAEYLPE